MAEMKISEISRKLGVKPETIRFWERVGVMPKAKRKKISAGLGYPYRYYTEEDLKIGFFILNAKKLGFSLKEIRELLQLRAYDSPEKCDIIAGKIEKHVRKIRQRYEFLMSMEKALMKLLGDCRRRKNRGGKDRKNKITCPIIEYLEMEKFTDDFYGDKTNQKTKKDKEVNRK